MKESDYQRKIIKKYEAEGYFVIKLIRTNVAGIPDLLILKANETPIFIECKVPNGKLSELQKYRIDELIKKGFNVKLSYGNEIIELKEYYKEKIKLLNISALEN